MSTYLPAIAIVDDVIVANGRIILDGKDFIVNGDAVFFIKAGRVCGDIVHIGVSGGEDIYLGVAGGLGQQRRALNPSKRLQRT